MVSTHVKNISQIGSFPQVGVKIKNMRNHHPGNESYRDHFSISMEEDSEIYAHPNAVNVYLSHEQEYVTFH